MDDIGSILGDVVVDGRRRCQTTLTADHGLTHRVQAEDVTSVGMEWLIAQLACCSCPRGSFAHLADIGVWSLTLIVRACLRTQVGQVNWIPC